MESLLENIDTEAVTTYLAVLGWRTERVDPRRSIWRHPLSGTRVFIPGGPGPDEMDLLRLALHEIAIVEERDEEELATDLAWRRFDRLELRRAVPASALSLGEAISIHEALQGVIVAAARSASGIRRTFSGRRPGPVDDYVDQVQVIPPVRGSFVIRALLPVGPPPQQAPLPLVGLATPETRRVSALILTGATAAVETAGEVASGAPLSLWDEVVSAGVSSNLCDALAQLPGPGSANDSGDATLRLEWSWTEQGEPLPEVTVPVGIAPVLFAAGAYLRDEPEEYLIRLTGLITKLHRETATGPGDITVKGNIENFDSGPRAIKVNLDETSYRSALAAHDAGISVQVTALVRRDARSLQVIRVEDLNILDAQSR